MSDRPSAHPLIDATPRPGVRTFTPRWRNSPLTQERMEMLLPQYALPAGPLSASSVGCPSTTPLVVEIGSGHGAAAIAYALNHPDALVIALDVHVPGVARMLAAAEQASAHNLRADVDDALVFLRERVSHNSLAAVHLFFPDPWPKRRHTKRRFVQVHSLEVIASRLAADGVFRIATDIEAYADHCREQFAHHGGWKVIEGERPVWRPTDGFEDKGRAAGRSIFEFTARRNSPAAGE